MPFDSIKAAKFAGANFRMAREAMRDARGASDYHKSICVRNARHHNRMGVGYLQLARMKQQSEMIHAI